MLNSGTGDVPCGISLSNTVHSEVAPCLPLPSLPVFGGALDQELSLFDDGRSRWSSNQGDVPGKIADLLRNTDVSYLNLTDQSSVQPGASIGNSDLFDKVLRHDPDAFECVGPGSVEEPIYRRDLTGSTSFERHMPVLSQLPRETGEMRGDADQVQTEIPNHKVHSSVSNSVKRRSDAGTSAYTRLGVSRIYKLIRTNRVSRNRFMSSVVRKFEMPRWNNYVIPFLMYCTEILALLPFTSPDEPLYLIYTINRLVQVRAGMLESNMKDFLHSLEGIYPKDIGNGIVQSNQTIQSVSERSMSDDGNHKISEEFPGSHLSGDPQSKNSDIMEDSYSMPKIDLQKIQVDCLAIGAIQLLLKLKRHLKIVFGLDDARCQAYSPNEPPKPGESLLRQNISFSINDINIDPPNTSEDFSRRYQDLKNALNEDTVDYATYTANIKRKRPPLRRGGKVSRTADAEDEDDNEDENWTNGVNRINRSGRIGGMRTRQRY